ncbi:hypothetical protein [Bosea sp. (in: a-proteobacteria)]|uniref:hypothetical protein n=1 Tax=Bosea sp. (in: a-proteobacteria) TaxID=1871050 RepID=UPI0026225991|nr:hypothetical protein [Bosea sp. (in: a-proteobacteria)]MCO5090918.1 hypothetical protein [Bosea sp. (in: a-proteobacteria)]
MLAMEAGISMSGKTEMPRRGEFLPAALDRFARYGYSGTPMRDIGAGVGPVHSAICNYPGAVAATRRRTRAVAEA